MLTWQLNDGMFEGTKVARIYEHGNLYAILYPTGSSIFGYKSDQISHTVNDVIEGKWWCERNFDPDVFYEANQQQLCYSETHKQIMIEKRSIYIPIYAKRFDENGKLSNTDIVEITMPVNGVLGRHGYKEKYPDAIDLGTGRRIIIPQ